MVNDITRFLKGNDDILIKRIENKMHEAALNLDYEKAQEMKLLLDNINTILKNQSMDLINNIDCDIFGFIEKKELIAIQVFHLRGGKLVERDSSIFSIVDNVKEDLTYYICSFYDEHNLKPKEILIPKELDALLIEKILGIKVLIPQKGKKKKLVDMACKNAAIALNEKFEIIKRDREKTCDGNEKLGELLGIDNLHRIEIFDNSHLFGTFSVSGMVVFINGKALKKEYRKYKITTEKKDDYHMIKEVIYRRYFRVLKDDLEKPDLVIVDGGKIQVNAALEVINDLRLNIPVCGLKKDNKHKTSQLFFKNKNIDINHQSPLFYLLERIQEEVHRFTINYHKNIRSKGALESFLDNIEGIGPKRKIKLIKRFKSLSKIKEASFSELRKILPQKVVKNLKEYFNKNVK
jgi:excinuclease ABC subunit C